MSAVTIHNADGVNPYAGELASLLHRRGLRVTLVDARNSEHEPVDGVRWRRQLPENFGGGSGRQQLVRLVRGLLTTLWAGLGRREVVLVAFTRFPVEDLLLAALAAVGRPVVVVVHNPVPRKAESRLAHAARRALLAQATRGVVHAERLRSAVDARVAGRVSVCPHPPYVQTARSCTAAAPELTGRRWVAFVGALRWDKGIDLVPEVLARVPEEHRRQLGLVVCGMGRLDDEVWTRLRSLGIEVRDVTSHEPVPEQVLLGVLAERPTVLAPYVAATQSGSIILALTLGCGVLAFDEGGIPDVVTRDGLVPTGDLEAMAAAVAEGRSGSSVSEIDVWAERAADAWAAVVTDVSALRAAGDA